MSSERRAFEREHPFTQGWVKYPDRAALNRAIADRIELTWYYTGQRSPEEIAWLQKYTGMGGMQKFDQKGSGILHEYFTPVELCDAVWQLVRHHGYKKGAILEPSAGIGRMLMGAPAGEAIVAYELDNLAWKIMVICLRNEDKWPGAVFHNYPFETAFLEPPRFTTKVSGKRGRISHLQDVDPLPFQLVLGNPPYGKFVGKYTSFFASDKMLQYEHWFMFKSLQLLKPGGLLAMVVPSGFLRNGASYHEAKKSIFIMADLVDAHRLGTVFEGTDVPTDIIILRKT